jgi:hypothetical protein
LSLPKMVTGSNVCKAFFTAAVTWEYIPGWGTLNLSSNRLYLGAG